MELMSARTLVSLAATLFLAACGSSAASSDRAGGNGDTALQPVSNDCTTLRTYPNCGTCSQTVEEHCSVATDCLLDGSRICARIWFGAEWSRGCGYLRVVYYGDVGDRATDIWDESSGKLVYHWFNGMLSSGCLPAITVGTAPVCDAWTNACGSDAGAEAGGGG